MNLLINNLRLLQKQIEQDHAKKPTIIAVSKTIASNKIRDLYQNGHFEFGENYVQEFYNKTIELSDLDISWHFIGKIQANKTKYIAEKASWAHCIENEKQVIRLNSQRPVNLPALNLLIAVNISHEITKSGLSTFEEVAQLAEIIVKHKNLKLRGLMGIASATSDTNLIRQQFTNLKSYFDKLHSIYPSLIDSLSMGMSNDYNIALEVGANMIRIGTLIFGERK